MIPEVKHEAGLSLFMIDNYPEASKLKEARSCDILFVVVAT